MFVTVNAPGYVQKNILIRSGGKHSRGQLRKQPQHLCDITGDTLAPKAFFCQTTSTWRLHHNGTYICSSLYGNMQLFAWRAPCQDFFFFFCSPAATTGCCESGIVENNTALESLWYSHITTKSLLVVTLTSIITTRHPGLLTCLQAPHPATKYFLGTLVLVHRGEVVFLLMTLTARHWLEEQLSLRCHPWGYHFFFPREPASFTANALTWTIEQVHLHSVSPERWNAKRSFDCCFLDNSHTQPLGQKIKTEKSNVLTLFIVVCGQLRSTALPYSARFFSGSEKIPLPTQGFTDSQSLRMTVVICICRCGFRNFQTDLKMLSWWRCAPIWMRWEAGLPAFLPGWARVSPNPPPRCCLTLADPLGTFSTWMFIPWCCITDVFGANVDARTTALCFSWRFCITVLDLFQLHQILISILFNLTLFSNADLIES